MSEIRPTLPAVSSVPSSPARTAQAAFFKAALAQVQATQSQASPPRTQEDRATPPSQPTGEPTRMSRPGSLLDIRV
ncbi:hypothetical protein BH10PSE2_BH10PSE2_06570 [soil metagenome]